MDAYRLYWLLGGAVGFLAALWHLHTRRQLTWSTYAAVSVAWIGLYVGAKWQYQMEATGAFLESLPFRPGDWTEPGMRISLGLIVGGLLGGAWCVATRSSWRDTGDALALSATLMVAVGRIGCYVNHCCQGEACPPALRGFCKALAYGGGPLAAADHPLPLYFSASSLVIFGILLAIRAAGVQAGAMLAVFCVLRPLSKLSLETLRANSMVSPLVSAVPATFLTVALVVLAARAVVLRTSGPRSSARLVGQPVWLILLVGGAPASAAVSFVDPPEGNPSWGTFLVEYAANPLQHLDTLLALDVDSADELPPAVQLAIADAHLRAHDASAAEEWFRASLQRNGVEQRFRTWAELGLGWVRLLRGDYAAGIEHFEGVWESAGEEGELAGTVLSFVEPGRVDARVGDSGAPTERFAQAYAAYLNADFPTASKRFSALAQQWRAGDLADTARYAAALSQLHDGDREGAEAELRSLAGGLPADAASRDVGLLNLEPYDLLHYAFERYIGVPLLEPLQRPLSLFPGDMRALAAVALVRLDELEGRRPRPLLVVPRVDARQHRQALRARARGIAVDRPHWIPELSARRRVNGSSMKEVARVPEMRSPLALVTIGSALLGVVAFVWAARRIAEAP